VLTLALSRVQVFMAPPKELDAPLGKVLHSGCVVQRSTACSDLAPTARGV